MIFLEISKAIIISVIFMPLSIKAGKLASSLKREEVIHRSSKNIYRTGSISILFGVMLTLLTNHNFYLSLNNIFSNSSIIITILLCSLGIFFLGFFDDLKSLSPLTRLIIQILISILVFEKGIRFDIANIEFLDFLNLQSPFTNALSLLITILWIVGLINAINWLDGLDGLASGFTIIILISLIYIGKYNGINLEIFLIPIIGSCIGFLIFNFFPAKIYMGDAGSYFLGFNLSVWSILGTNSSLLTNSNPDQLSGIIICFILMFMPVFDMSLLIFKRTRSRKSPFFPDKNHFHHMVINCGFTHRSAVLFYYLIIQWFALLAYSLTIKNLFNNCFILSSFILIGYSISRIRKIKLLAKLLFK